MRKSIKIYIRQEILKIQNAYNEYISDELPFEEGLTVSNLEEIFYSMAKYIGKYDIILEDGDSYKTIKGNIKQHPDFLEYLVDYLLDKEILYECYKDSYEDGPQSDCIGLYPTVNTILHFVASLFNSRFSISFKKSLIRNKVNYENKRVNPI